MKLPNAANKNLVTQELDKELLIYNLLTDQAYTLNETSMIVFNACNGETSFDELKKNYRLTDEIIYLALDELKKQNLLAAETVYESPFAGMSRREVIRRAGFASMIALPLIAGISAPRAAQAASGTQVVNSICTTETSSGSTECRSGRCSRTQTIARGDDGVSNSTGNSGVTRCCASTNTGAGYESNNTYYNPNDCSFAALCCSGTGNSSTVPNAKGSYTCTCN